MKYNKLVRDRIPEIIEKNGEEPLVETLEDERFYDELLKKLQEEVDEFLGSGEIEELADVMEVIRKVLEMKGKDMVYLEEVRIEKAERRGGFDQKIYLKGVK